MCSRGTRIRFAVSSTRRIRLIDSSLCGFMARFFGRWARPSIRQRYSVSTLDRFGVNRSKIWTRCTLCTTMPFGNNSIDSSSTPSYSAELFEQEEADLMKDLAILPRQSAVRKINELVKRIRKVKALAYIVGYLKSQMPTVMGKEKKQQKLIQDMPNVFRTIMKKHNLAPGDFPDINKFSEKLKDTKFSEFATLKMEQIQLLEDCLSKSLPKLMEELPSEKDSPETLRAKMGDHAGNSPSLIPVPNRANKFGKANDGTSNPFGFGEEDEDNYWALEESAERLKDSFEALGPVGGFLSPQVAKDVLVKTGLQKDQLRQIWNLSDIDRDGYFDHHEYVVAMFLCDAVIQKGRPIPSELPASVIPPSKRALVKGRGF
eukprot:CCRYP_006363-RA/>CCRYP_006363-RA protein AED:0.02 eAED:0.02 QI:693/1/1/1/0/0.5/2/232/373